MSEFLDALVKFPFLQHAVIAGLLASVSGGIVGTYVVTRRITYIGGGIAHSVLGGLGAAYFVSVVYKWDFVDPVFGAVLAAIISALVIGLISMKARGREDTVISAVWAVGMAAGIIFIARTPGYNQDLLSYLFGNILMARSSDLWLIGALDIFVLVIGLGFYRQLTAVCFDEEFARTRGIKVEYFYLLLLSLTALTIVLLVMVVGVVMVIALLTLPVAIANLYFKKMWQIMLAAVVFSSLFTFFGLAVSYRLDLPSGAVIILISGLVFLILASIQAIPGRSASK